MNILKLSILNLIRDKLKSLIYIFICTFLILVILLSFNISNILDKYINYNLNLNEDSRKITLTIHDDQSTFSKDELLSSLNSTEFIKDVSVKYDNLLISYYVIVNNYTNIENVKNNVTKILDKDIKISNYTITYNDYINNENQMLIKLKYITDLMLFVIIVLIFISINIIIKQSIDENIYDISIYKSCGYSNKHIFKLVFFEVFIITTISYISSCIISIGVLNLCINIISKIIHINLIDIDINVFLTCFLTLILVYTICFVVSLLELSKIKNISIKSLINEFN